MFREELRQRAEAEIAAGFSEIGDAEEAGPLHRAAHAGDVELCGALLELGESVDCMDFDEYTPIFYAAGGGHLAAATLLLDKRANPNLREIGFPSMRRSRKGWTPLHAAAAGGHAHVVGLLLSRGAAESAKSADGETALDLAVRLSAEFDAAGSLDVLQSMSDMIHELQSARVAAEAANIKQCNEKEAAELRAREELIKKSSLPFAPGLLVHLYGLQAKPELNDAIGQLIQFDEKKGRWQVRFDGTQEDVLLKETNIKPFA